MVMKCDVLAHHNCHRPQCIGYGTYNHVYEDYPVVILCVAVYVTVSNNSVCVFNLCAVSQLITVLIVPQISAPNPELFSIILGKYLAGTMLQWTPTSPLPLVPGIEQEISNSACAYAGQEMVFIYSFTLTISLQGIWYSLTFQAFLWTGFSWFYFVTSNQ